MVSSKSETKVSKATKPGYKCRMCDKSFEKAQQLGGHISKSHPGCSKKYEEKVARSKEREGERKLLQTSKDLTQSIYPDLDIKIHKSKVDKVRKMIREVMAADPSLDLAEAC